MTMTCADCRELLLDLIYGELPSEKAAEVELHLAGCAECREERARMESTRAPFLGWKKREASQNVSVK